MRPYASPDIFQNRAGRAVPMSKTGCRHVVNFPVIYIYPHLGTFHSNPLVVFIATNQPFIEAKRNIRLLLQDPPLLCPCVSHWPLTISGLPVVSITERVWEAAGMHERITRDYPPREAGVSILVLSVVVVGSVALRMASKRITTSSIRVDDYLILVATV
jgi:hypothetical protein